MATRRPSSKLISHLLHASKTPSRARSSFLPQPFPQPTRLLSSSRRLYKENTAPPPPSQSQSNTQQTSPTTQTPTGAAAPPPPAERTHRIYTFKEITSLTTTPKPHTLLIDVREPSELQSTGRIPSAVNLPLKSSPDFMFLSADEFEDRFGRPRPTEKDEVIFYCRSGVRSRAAAELAKTAGFGGTVGEFPGSWLEWEKSGGRVERGG